MAIWELAPGSPWNAIFMVFVMVPWFKRSGVGQNAASGFEIVGRINAERHRIHDGRVDPHSCFPRPALFELRALFQHRWLELDVALQRVAPIGVEPDVMVARTVAVRRGGAGKIQRPEPLAVQWGADQFYDAWGGVLLILSDLGGQRSDVHPCILEQ